MTNSTNVHQQGDCIVENIPTGHQTMYNYKKYIAMISRHFNAGFWLLYCLTKTQPWTVMFWSHIYQHTTNTVIMMPDMLWQAFQVKHLCTFRNAEKRTYTSVKKQSKITSRRSEEEHSVQNAFSWKHIIMIMRSLGICSSADSLLLGNKKTIFTE